LNVVVAIAQEFSPRYERHGDDLVSVDVSGLTRLLGPARTIGEEMRREAAARGVRVHVAVAGTRMAALLIALARPGLTIVAPGGEAEALAPLAIGILEKVCDEDGTQSAQSTQRKSDQKGFAAFAGLAFKKWGLKTLGELASLPAADLVSRLGRPARVWQAMARGEDIRPLVPMLDEERFEASLDLEWPIADLEPLSFVLTRLLEPLSTRLERRDRGAAVLHVLLRLVTRDASGSGRETCARRLELPAPMRDVRALRTLVLLDLESHPADAAIDRVTIVIDPTPGRVVQHTLYTRAQPTPEQLSTLVARLGALMGQDRFGAPAAVDTDRPGAFAMTPFVTDPDKTMERKTRKAREEYPSQSLESSAGFAFPSQPSALSPPPLTSALRRCRQPVPARVAVADGRPVRVTTDRRGFTGGTVTHCAGPWRTSGAWWMDVTRTAQVSSLNSQRGETSDWRVESCAWNRDEWDVSLSDGAVYRVFRDRDADRWFIDAVVD
jgi:protein ImuB